VVAWADAGHEVVLESGHILDSGGQVVGIGEAGPGKDVNINFSVTPTTHSHSCISRQSSSSLNCQAVLPL
jgi:hypothetical protein